MEKINGELRKLCTSLEGRCAARLDGEYEEYHRLRQRLDELAPGMENERHEVEAELARLRLLVYNVRQVELNRLRQQVADASRAAAAEWAKHSGKVVDRERTRGPVEVDVHSEAELEALLLSPYIRQAVTLEALHQIIRFYRQIDAGNIVVRIHDVRAGKPGITWRWPEEQ